MQLINRQRSDKCDSGLLLQIDEKLRGYSRGRGRGRGGLSGRGSYESRPSHGASEAAQLPSRPSQDDDRHESRPQSRSRFSDRLGPPNEPSTSQRHDVRRAKRSRLSYSKLADHSENGISVHGQSCSCSLSDTESPVKCSDSLAYVCPRSATFHLHQHVSCLQWLLLERLERPTNLAR